MKSASSTERQMVNVCEVRHEKFETFSGVPPAQVFQGYVMTFQHYIYNLQ
jgi:hypothetical protein